MHSPRILLSEGSSLSARETITALGLAGHRVDLVTSDRQCLGRFSRFVRLVHLAPAPGRDPDGYLRAVSGIIERDRIDVLLPVHEQAYLFAAALRSLPPGLGLALAAFDSFAQVQSKAAFSDLLLRLNIPQPETRVIRNAAALDGVGQFPCYAKTEYGTASAGVWRVRDREHLAALRQDWQARGVFAAGLLVQAEVHGPLERCQAVFDRGRLIGFHAYRQIVAGPGGGDVLKCSVTRPAMRAMVSRIGAELAWHGALCFDCILDEATGTPRFIDANPRLVEPMNALHAGVDLAGALLELSLGRSPAPQPDGRDGVVTRLGLMGLLDAAGRRGARRDVCVELARLMRGAGHYAGSIEELTPLSRDPWAILPLGLVTTRLLIDPAAAARIGGATVRSYSLTPQAILRLGEWHRNATDHAAGVPPASSCSAAIHG